MSKKKKSTEDTEIKKVSNNPTKIEPPVEETEEIDPVDEENNLKSGDERGSKKYHCPKCGTKYTEDEAGNIDLGGSKHCVKCFAEGIARFAPPLLPYSTREE